MKPEEQLQSSQLFSELVVADYLGDLEIDGFKGLTKLDASTLKGNDNPDAKAQRFELINHSLAGKHLELSVTAQTYAQTKKPNRRYLRLGEDKLDSRAGTWKGQPYLVDHNTWSMKSSMGTLLSSKAVAIDSGTAFEQKLHAVKGDAVRGILDGTFNKFSIGWFPNGPILCSVHGCDIMKLDGCNCWPGDKVKLDDGRERVAEFIFTDFLGKETSSVVIPAVQDTHVDEVRAALAAELHLTRPHRKTVAVPSPKENEMSFHRLAVALGLTALSEGDEDRAVAAVSALQARANTAETQLSTARASLTAAEAAVQTLTAAAVGAQIDTVLRTDGYAAGKLRHARDEAGKPIAGAVDKWLRGLGQTGGLEVMKAQLAQMPVIVPVGQRQAAGAGEPERTELGADEEELTKDNPYLKNAAALTGQKVEDLVAFASNHTTGGA